MVVYEIKNPAPAPKVKKVNLRREVMPAIPVTDSRAIDMLLLKRKIDRDDDKKRSRVIIPLFEDKAKAVRRLIRLINDKLEECKILIHLTLVESEEGFAIDVYDCSTEEVCNIIHDISITLDELPDLLLRLQNESGIIVDQKL